MSADQPAAVGSRGLAARAMAEGRTAGTAGDPATDCPYGRDRPFTRRAWLVGYARGRVNAGLPTPSTVADTVDPDAPGPDSSSIPPPANSRP